MTEARVRLVRRCLDAESHAPLPATLPPVASRKQIFSSSSISISCFFF